MILYAQPDAKKLTSTNQKVAGKEKWYPTQAKTGLEWGTQPWLPVKQDHCFSNSRRESIART
jgi:hypothetical protein